MIYGTESHETKWSTYALMENAFYSHCKALLAGIGKTVAASSKSMFLNFKMFRTLYVKKMIHLTPPWRMPSTHPWNRLSFQIMKDDSLRGFSRTADFFFNGGKNKKNNSENRILASWAGKFCWMCYRGAETETGEQRRAGVPGLSHQPRGAAINQPL